MSKRYPGPGPYTFREGVFYFKSSDIMREFREANPDCVCMYDDYDNHMNPVLDCPGHGEAAKVTAEAKSGAPSWDTRYGSPNCRCTRTGPENTYEVNPKCGLHGPQTADESPGMEEVQGNKDAAPGAAYDPPPDHYSTGAGIDPWQVWDAFGLDKDAYLANAVKYILRAGKKDIAPRLDDLIKARNYINKAIEKESSA